MIAPTAFDPKRAFRLADRAAAKPLGSTLQAIKQKLAKLGTPKRVLGFSHDTGERYLSVPDFLPGA